MRAMTVVARVALIVCAAGGLARPVWADSAEAARKHAGKAGQLAAKNRCKAAVPEFTKAYKVLKDPTLLFNRAECNRKLGRNADALKDYEQFLADMPAAPNRKNVESHIALLKATASLAASALLAGSAQTAAAASASAAPVAPAASPAPKPASLGTAGAAGPATDKPSGAAASSTAGTAKAESDSPEDKEPVHHAEKWTD
jgi:hypothetical protein